MPLYPSHNTTLSRRPVLLGLLACVLCAAGTAPGVLRAQSGPVDRAERMREEALGRDSFRESDDSFAEDEAEEEESAADTTPFGVDLAEVHLIPHQDRATLSPGLSGEDVAIDSELPAPGGLEEVLRPYLGEPMSMDLLTRLSRDVVLAWREGDYPLVDVYFPEQNISEGKLQVVVREAVLGKKTQEGAERTRPEYLVENLRLSPGDRVNRRVVQADLDWLNENPVRQVNVIYQRGEMDGTSDIVIDVHEEQALTAYAGFANTGIDLTGEEEWSFGFNLANPWRREQAIGYHYTTDLEWDSLEAHSVFYQAWLPWRHTLRLVGAHVDSVAEDPGLLGLEGESSQFSAEYRIPLQRPEFNRKWRHAVTAAFDYKRTNSDLFFGGQNVFASDVEVGQFRFEYEAAVPDQFGMNRFAAGLVASPGDLFGHNDDASFQLSRAGTEADYFYAFAELEKLVRLPADWTFRFKSTSQAAGDRLASTEQMLGGGYATVRGYDENLVRADAGFLVNLELISPEFSLLNRALPEVHDRWNAVFFYDAAAFRINDRLPGEISPSLQSVGLGLDCRIGERGHARVAYGWAVENHGVDAALVEDGKVHFGVTVLY